MNPGLAQKIPRSVDRANMDDATRLRLLENDADEGERSLEEKFAAVMDELRSMRQLFIGALLGWVAAALGLALTVWLTSR